MRQRFWFFMLLVIIGESARAEDTTAIAAKSPPTVHDIGSRRELFVVDAFDSQNLAFWDSVRGEYRAYWRIFSKGITNEKTWEPEGVRAIRTAHDEPTQIESA